MSEVEVVDVAENPEKAEAPVETKVGCCNHITRWVGCCDLFGGDEPPNLRQGVLKKRACTDLPWIFLHIIFVVLIYVTVWGPASADGQYKRFLGASDYLLNTCGQDEFDDYPYAAWPDLSVYNVKVCVASCDETINNAYFSDGLIDGGYKSSETVFWCIPKDVSGQVYDAWLAEYEDNDLVRYMTDLYTYWEVPVYALAFTFVFLFGYFLFVRWFLGLILKALYVGLLVGTLFGAFSFMRDGREADEAGYYTGVTILIIGLSLWFVMMCCWTKLSAIVDVLKQASKALLSMPQLILMPLITLPFTIGLLVLWCLITMLIFSSGDSSEQSVAFDIGMEDAISSLTAYQLLYVDDIPMDVYREYDYDTNVQVTEFFFHLFWLLWGLKFIEYFNFVVVSGCVADWYLDRELVDNPEENEEFRKANCSRMGASIWRTLRYHLGTIGFASALVAAIQTAEAILMYVKKQMDGSDNPFAKTVLKVVMAIVKCLECIINRCNKSTLVITAVLGTPFCAGCGKTLELFFNHMAEMSLGTGMIMLLIMLSNFMIALLSSGLCGYLFLGVDNQEDLNSNLMPLFSSFVFSFFLAQILLSVWDCSATTILICRLMLTEWYPEEFGKGLVSKAEKVDRNPKNNQENEVELMYQEELAV